MPDNSRIPTPAPADRPTLKIMASGAQISGEYQVKAVTVTRGFNRVCAAEILIHDGDPASETFKASDTADFVPGKEIEIVAGYHGNESTIFKGIVVRHGVRARSKGQSWLHVECKDKAVKLTVGRKSVQFYDMTDADIIERIAGDAGLDTDVEATSVTHKQMAQCLATDWDFLLTRAEANGRLVVTLDGKLVVKAPDASKQPILAAAYGRNLLDFEAVMDARDQFGAVQSSAWDSAGQAVVEIDGASPSARAPGNISQGDLAGVIGADTLKLQHGGQLINAELQAWADGHRMRSAFAKVRGRIRIQGFGGVLPGDIVDLAGVGARFNGKALVSGVRHEINTENWETDVTFGISPEVLSATDWRVSGAPASGLLPALSGLHIGLVTALEDPEGEDRIQVRVPFIGINEEGMWARIASLDAGRERGTFFRPEIDDEVVLGFLNDDPRNPVVLGMLNSSAKPAPLKARDANPQKGLVTREKIKLIFDDEKKAVTLETPGGNSIVLSDDQGSISIVDQNGTKLVLDSGGVSIESAADVKIKASGDVKIEGANITTSANAQLQAKGSAGAEFSSSGSTVLKGSVVQIN